MKDRPITAAVLTLGTLVLSAGIAMLFTGQNAWVVTGIGAAMCGIALIIRKARAVRKSEQPEKPEHDRIGIGVFNGEDIVVSENITPSIRVEGTRRVDINRNEVGQSDE